MRGDARRAPAHRGRAGRRELDAEAFFQGPYTTALEPTEMLEAVAFPDGAGTEAVVVEHARRHGDFAVVSVAAAGLPAPDGSWRWIRIGLGAVADGARYARRASESLAGTRLQRADIEAAAARCLEVASQPRTSAPPPSTGGTSFRSSWGARSTSWRGGVNETFYVSAEARPGWAGTCPSVGGLGAISGPPGRSMSTRMTVTLRVNGRAYNASSRAADCSSTSCATNSSSTARTSAASRVSAAPAPCWSTAIR